MRRSSRPPFLEGKRFAGAVAVKETPEPGGRRAAPVATLLGNNCTLPNGASPTLQSPPMGWIEEFPGNFVWSNATLVTKGMAPYGAVALGEIDEVCQRLRARQGEPGAWTEEWSAMGRRLEAVADAAAAEGRAMSAGNYYFTAERFVKAPGVSGRAPTVVVFDGMDNCKEMSVLFAGLEFAARGWNTLAIDGPGQGESLRLRGLHARHDYEVPGTAAYEYVARRREVDPQRVVIMGYSFGGYYASRIAAFEKRYCAGVAMSALHWDLAAWQREVRRRHETDPKTTPQSSFHFRWIMGADDIDAAIERAERFSLAGVAQKIACPFLIVHAQDDKVVPVASAHKLFEVIGARRKSLKILTAEDGSTYHAQADNRQVGIDHIADWIGANM